MRAIGLVLGILVAALAGCASPPRPGEGGASFRPSFRRRRPGRRRIRAREGYPVKPIDRPLGSSSALQSSTTRSSRAGWFAVPRCRHDSARAAAEPTLRYEYAGKTLTLDDYLARNPATGLLIARDDTILVERYQYARNDRHRFTSFSMAKTVTAMLIGIAIAEGRIRSVDDPAEAYVPALADTEYGRTSIRASAADVLGRPLHREYSGRDDVSRLWADTVPSGRAARRGDAVQQAAPPGGTTFAYASAETQVLGLVLRGAVGRPVADYLQEKIWEPMGAEADATWLIDRSGQEATYCCFNAVLRDYARLGLLLAHDGRLGDRQIIPAAGCAPPPPCPRTAGISSRTRPRRTSATATRPGSSPASAACSPCSGARPGHLGRPVEPPRDGPHRRAQGSLRLSRGEHRAVAGDREAARGLITRRRPSTSRRTGRSCTHPRRTAGAAP